MKLIRKIILNLLLKLIPSCIARAKILKLFGAKIGSGCKIEEIILLNYDGANLANLQLGNKVYIGAGSILDLKDKIIVSDSVKIAAGCNLSTHVDSGKENKVSELYPMRVEAIEIGESCWIGLNVTILCGVKIGNNSIVGACSLVNKEIPEKSLAYGIPVMVVNEIECSIPEGK